jgi:trans-aconitate 3-methyltransferase
VILHKRLTWTNLLAYFRTMSPLHAFHELYPEDRERSDGDLAVRFWRRLREGAASGAGGSNEGVMVGEEEGVDIEFPVALILVRRI